jgi:hypothetical protein
MNDYLKFIESKKHSTQNFGIEPTFIPDSMFDFQKYITEYAIKKGRCAIFLDTGLGKTIIELTIAYNYVKHTNKPVLIITPLAVAFQFIKEAEKFNIDDIEYSKNGSYTKKIVVCNYERLEHFNSSDFNCVILDESSILKNFDGAIKGHITTFLRKVKYRYLATATPSPNDFIELGTSSEALGYMGYMDMLKTFFANNENNIRPQEIGCKWYLKPHAKYDFFRWVSGWSITARKPSDLGYSDEKHILPELKQNYHYVKNDKNWVVNGQILMFGQIAKTMTEVRQEQQMTIENRCNKAVELTKDKNISVYWCNFNDESKLLKQLDKDSVELVGSMDLDKKENVLLNFANGNIKKLITKPKITAFGLNWQHCNHAVFFPTWSYEQYYQSIRRFWRFGQKKEVVIDLVLSDGQKRVIDALEMKIDKSNELFDLLNKSVNGQYITAKEREFNQTIIKPKFL